MTNKIKELYTNTVLLSSLLSESKESFIEEYRQDVVVLKSKFLNLKENVSEEKVENVLREIIDIAESIAKDKGIDLITKQQSDDSQDKVTGEQVREVLSNVINANKSKYKKVKKEIEEVTNPKWEEIIVVAPRKELFEDETLVFQGVTKDEDVIKKVMNNLEKTMKPMRRGGIEDKTLTENNAESNRDYKQPIPYPLIMRGEEVFVMERLEKGGESRLHGKLSVGAGGHMNPDDSITDLANLLMTNLQRELFEELYIDTEQLKISILGLINDDSNEVGEVHLGVLTKIVVPKGTQVDVREVDQLKGSWMTLEQLKQEDIYSRLENWSKMAVDCLVGE